MTAREQIRLVALREIRERVRTRTFQVSTALLVVVAVAAVVLADVTDGGTPAPVRVGVVGTAAAGPETSALPVERVAFTTQAEARRALGTGAVDLVVVPGERLLVEEEPDAGSRLSTVAAALARDGATREALRGAGVDDAVIARAVDRPPLPIAATEPTASASDDDTGAAFIATVVLYLALMFAGYAVAAGVVEEKTTRVAEVLLTSLRPARLLAGKVVGIGLAGLAQLVAAAVPVVVAVLVLSSDAIPDASGRIVAWSLVWFVLGYVLYACAYAAAGVLAGRQEDMQVVTIPVTALLVAAYLTSLNVLDDPDTTFARIASLFPPFAPMLMPGRIAVTDVPTWEIALSIVLAAAMAAALLWVAARVYGGALLRIGARTRLRVAWRTGGES